MLILHVLICYNANEKHLNEQGGVILVMCIAKFRVCYFQVILINWSWIYDDHGVAMEFHSVAKAKVFKARF